MPGFAGADTIGPVRFEDALPGSVIEVYGTGIDTFRATVIEMRPEFGATSIPALILSVDGDPQPQIVTASGQYKIRIVQNSALLASEIPPQTVERVRMKPVTKEAIQFTGGKGLAIDIIRWTAGGARINYLEEEIGEGGAGTEALVMKTLDGDQTLGIGYWIVKDSTGKFEAVAPEKFRTDFEIIPKLV